MALDRDALETFALTMVRTSSPSRAEGAIAELVRAELERLGYAVEVDALGNVIGTLDAGPGPCVVSVHGRPTHSSRPELGVNAVEAMADVLRAARDIELPSHRELVGAILVPTEIVSRPYPALRSCPTSAR